MGNIFSIVYILGVFAMFVFLSKSDAQERDTDRYFSLAVLASIVWPIVLLAIGVAWWDAKRKEKFLQDKEEDEWDE